MELLQKLPSCAKKGGSVSQWLTDLRNMTEIECMSILQGKPLQSESHESDPSSGVKELKDNIDVLKDEADDVSKDFAELFRCFEECRWNDLHTTAVEATKHIKSLTDTCNSRLKDAPVFVLEQQDMVKGEAAKLVQQSASYCTSEWDCEEEQDSSYFNKIPLVNQLTFLGQSFSRLVDLTLGYLVQKIAFDIVTVQIQADFPREKCAAIVRRNPAIVCLVDLGYLPLPEMDNLTNGSGLAIVHAAISCIIGLGLEGEHMCFIIAREGGVRGLLDVCRRETLTFTQSQALRALATICCAPECIAEFEKERGVELLVDLLCDTGWSGEVVQGEAAGVVAQLTSPCLQLGHSLGGLLLDLSRLLQALLQLCQKTLSHEVFLLSAAAIANLTFLHAQACPTLLQLGAPHLLIKAASTPKARSLFTKDQVATVMANMAANAACQVEIRQHGGVELLVRFLHERPVSVAGKAELAACERVQQKAAIALSRLSQAGSSTQSVICTKAVPRLVELCRQGDARNKSDAVLVACLAALRKICSVSGTEGIRPLDHRQLVQPPLMDSFLICSHTDENFV